LIQYASFNYLKTKKLLAKVRPGRFYIYIQFYQKQAQHSFLKNTPITC